MQNSSSNTNEEKQWEHAHVCPKCGHILGPNLIDLGSIVFSGSAKSGSTAVGKAAGMATGAALGAGAGTMASAATPGPTVTIPAEAQMDFYLASPISVVPVSAKEAARLAPRLHPGEPILYVRDGVQ